MLVKHFGPSEMTEDQYGLTGWKRSLTSSEVYTRGMSKNFVANLIFHESLHNKTHMGDSLHSRNGLAKGHLTEMTEFLVAYIRRTAGNVNHSNIVQT